MLNKEGNLGYLCKRYKKIDSSNKLAKLHEKLFNEFIEEIGLSREFKDYIDLLKKRHALSLLYIKGDRSKFAFIEILTEEIGGYFKKDYDENINKVVAQMSKFMGQRVQARKITVVEYHSILDLMNNARKDKS